MDLTNIPNLCDLPSEILLKIVFLLNPDDVLTLRGVCRTLYNFASSESLWKKLLEKDMELWSLISHSHNPLMGSSRPAMDVYRICRPRKSELCLPLSSFRSSSSLLAQFFGGLKSKMGSWAQADVPRVAIFGPGIESPRTSSIVPQLLGLPGHQDDTTSVMQLVEFLRPPPGAAGIGTGGLVELTPTGQRFHMVVLYTEFKDLRERESDFRDRVERSPFFVDQDGTPVPNTRSRDLFTSLSGMIYVVDSTCQTGQIPPSADKELHLLCQFAPSAAPLLVLAAFGSEVDQPAKHVSPASCVRQLDLCCMVRPWQVCAVRVEKGSQQLTVPVNWLGTSAAAHAK